MMKLSIVIPVYNGEDFLETTVLRFLEIDRWPFEIIIVDDASNDQTPSIIRRLSRKHKCIKSVNQKSNQGAGAARNIGFKKAKGEYVLFFDADDLVQVPALQNIIEYADRTDVDCVISGYQLASDASGDVRPMHHKDAIKWQEYLKGEVCTILPNSKIGHISSTTNYPWNKVIRTSFAKRVGLKFSDTPVHNDILGSWYATVLADSLALTSEVICTHIVPDNGNNITNIVDDRRMKIFDALQEVDDMLLKFPLKRIEHYHHFLNFSLILLKWAKTRIPEELKDEFGIQTSKVFSRASFSEHLKINKHMPRLSGEITKIRFNPRAIYK